MRRLAESDLGTILEDGVTGFGWPVSLTNPAGLTIQLVGFSNDIAQVIDPETGQAISGRSANCALRTSTIKTLGTALDPAFGIPQGISDTSAKPWIVNFLDINDAEHQFKVVQSNPDRTLGLISCLLEIYETAP